MIRKMMTLLVICGTSHSGVAAAGWEPATALQRRAHTTRYKMQRETPATQALTGINIAAFIVLARRPGLFSLLAKNDRMILQRGQWHRVATSCCLHASVPHLVVNQLSLHSVGPTVERRYGTKRFVTTYAVAGVAGNLCSLAMRRSPLAVGASGAIFGLVGAWAAFLHVNRALLESQGLRVSDSISAVLQTCALNAAFGMSPGSNIDNYGHLGGLIGGAAAGIVIGPRLRRLAITGIIVDEPIVPLPITGSKRGR